MPATFYASTSVKEQVLLNIQTTLQTISIANGYHNDVAKVLRYRIAGWQTLEYPTLIVVGVKERKRAVEGSPARVDVDMDFEVNAIMVESMIDDAEELHNMMLADIEYALQIDVQRGGIARDTTILGTDFEVVEAQIPYCVSTLSGSCRYTHSRQDPTRPW